MKTIILLSFAFALAACENSQHKSLSANYHMHKSSFEELVEKFENPERDQWQKPDLVIEKLGDIKGKKIADIGAGTGYFSRRLAQKGASVLALDIDEQFLNFINTHSSDSLTIVTRKIPFNSPQLDSAEVDAVIVVDTCSITEKPVKYAT